MSASPEKQTLAEWLAWQESLHPKEIELGLKRIKSVAEKLDLLEFSAKIVTVAGTNGKGSFVKSLGHLLKHDKTTFGAYTSPHIERYNERIAINGEPVSDESICSAFEVIDKARGEISLSYFEFGTLAALLVFKLAKLDVIILEIGLGGRLDAANIVDADIAVITSIDLDHQAWLGDTREKIGAEKAGILRPGIPFICVDENPPQSVIEAATKNACKPYLLGKEIISCRESERCVVKYPGRSQSLELNLWQLPLPSLIAAGQAYLLLEGKAAVTELGPMLSSITLAGRYERIKHEGQQFILDVAHNPQAARMLAARLERENLSNVVCVLALMSDKDIEGVLEPLRSHVGRWVATEIPSMPRSLPAADLASILGKQSPVSVERDPVDAFATAVELQGQMQDPKQAILVIGSFYLVGEFKTRYVSKVVI